MDRPPSYLWDCSWEFVCEYVLAPASSFSAARRSPFDWFDLTRDLTQFRWGIGRYAGSDYEAMAVSAADA